MIYKYQILKAIQCCSLINVILWCIEVSPDQGNLYTVKPLIRGTSIQWNLWSGEPLYSETSDQGNLYTVKPLIRGTSIQWNLWSGDTSIQWNLWSGDTSIQWNLWSGEPLYSETSDQGNLYTVKPLIRGTSIQWNLWSGDTSIHHNMTLMREQYCIVLRIWYFYIILPRFHCIEVSPAQKFHCIEVSPDQSFTA